ncbi:hypothetical protein [Ornithinimicrobium cavernae]|uniref:hypothetical protein n=1 Tax=Ornithinimicrobium cavernae TaxID=2666047 RepID=UPI000D693A58|nr:hypothetical protein [Ornithinimicrobium cavernae]
MKFSMQVDLERTVISTVPGEFDGDPPVPHLDIGLPLDGIASADRLAVGLALIYSPWLSGPVEFPEAVSALTAQRISEFFGERFVTVTGIADRALPIPRGVGDVLVVDLALRSRPPADERALCLAPLSQAQGTVSFGQQLMVASNVHLLTGTPSTGLHTLGLAIVLAECADANILVHPSADNVPPALNLLLESVGLGLTQE